LWSGVDFSFSDPLTEPVETLEQALFPGNVSGDPHTGVDQRGPLAEFGICEIAPQHGNLRCCLNPAARD